MTDKMSLGVISSFNVLCGIATYTEELCVGLSKFLI